MEAILKIYGNEPTRFIPKRYISPGIRLHKDDGSYYTIINEWNNGEFPGADGSSILIYVDQEPTKGEIVEINKELSKLIFV